MEDPKLLDDEGLLPVATDDAIVKWWEDRRITYNKIVAVAGVAVFALMVIVEPSLVTEAFGVVFFLAFSILFFLVYNVAYIFTGLLNVVYSRVCKKDLAESTKKVLFRLWIFCSILPFLFLLFLAIELSGFQF